MNMPPPRYREGQPILYSALLLEWRKISIPIFGLLISFEKDLKILPGAEIWEPSISVHAWRWWCFSGHMFIEQ